MKNYWTDQKRNKQKRLDEALELERIWMKMNLIALTDRFIRPTNIQFEEYDDCDFRGAD